MKILSYPRWHGRSLLLILLSLVLARSTVGFAAPQARHSVQDACAVDGPDLTCPKFLIHWKGEGIEGYSMQFRHVEFQGALAAVWGKQQQAVEFHNALHYTGSMHAVKRVRFNQAMQYVSIDKNVSPQAIMAAAAQRCSLVHALYQVVCQADSYKILATSALQNDGFIDMVPGCQNENATWCVRVRHYDSQDANSLLYKRHGRRARSLSRERQALAELKPLLQTFGGSVNLQQPDCKIYVFDGLVGGKVLVRRIASGAKVSVLAPNTRICVTNTPLCPIAAFVLCNVASVRPGDTILDPFAGSCAILLAATMMEPNIQTVGIEIAHNGLVNRKDIHQDFVHRNLTEPVALLHGDSTCPDIRRRARQVIGGGPFDLIITDPPYGIRESKQHTAPMDELLEALARDVVAGTPLLKSGGKLVCFVPCQDDQVLSDILPTTGQMKQAGLRLEFCREQPLNDKLSRWLVSFVCTL